MRQGTVEFFAAYDAAATHHTIPTEGAAELERQLLGYLAANPRDRRTRPE